MELVGMNTLLAYANDLVILGTSINEIKTSAEKLFKVSQNMGLIVNEAKTKYMVLSRKVSPKNNLKVHGYSFEQVKEFNYLGVNINEENNTHDEIKLRLSAVNKRY